MEASLGYLNTTYAREKMIEEYNKPYREKSMNIKIIQGQVSKVQTTADSCIRLTVDVDKAFADGVNLLAWKDNMVAIQLEGEQNEHIS